MKPLLCISSYYVSQTQLTLLVDGELHPPPADEAGGDLPGERGEGIAGLFRPVAYPPGRRRRRLRVGRGGGGLLQLGVLAGHHGWT